MTLEASVARRESSRDALHGASTMRATPATHARGYAGIPRFLRSLLRSPVAASVPPFHVRNPVCINEFDAAERWAAGRYGPQDVIGADGRGGFTAWYFPFGGPGVLLATQNVAVSFKDTLVSSGGAVTPHPDLPASPALSALTIQLGLLPPLPRAVLLSMYQWTGAERAPWMANIRSTVESSWGFQHEFFLNQPRWNWIGAKVAVSVNLAEGAKAAGDHMELEVYKVPPDQTLRSFDISHQVSHGSGTDARDQQMHLASTTIKPEQLLRRSVLFGP
jgi:hypothetical protein